MPKIPLIRLLSACAAACSAACAALPAAACSTWAAAGEGVTEDGGTLVFKILDEQASLKRAIATVASGGGYRFRGILTGSARHLNSGVNEKGLFVGGSTASSVPKAQRLSLRWYSKEGWRSREYLIRTCATVDEVLSRKEVLCSGYPERLVVADRHSVATIQTLEDGTFTVERTSHGWVAGTNHFTGGHAQAFNRKIGGSSKARLERIQQLLASHARPLTLQDMVAMAHDRHDGNPGRCIWREGVPPGASRSLAAIGVQIAPDGKVLLWERIRRSPNDEGSEWTETVHPLDLH